MPYFVEFYWPKKEEDERTVQMWKRCLIVPYQLMHFWDAYAVSSLVRSGCYCIRMNRWHLTIPGYSGVMTMQFILVLNTLILVLKNFLSFCFNDV
jgi:hypothetical protein